jgi:hypothetical protein
VEAAGSGEREGWNQCIEMVALSINHIVTTLHTPDWGIQNGTTGVTKGLPWIELWLFSNNPLTSYFLGFAIGIGNDPVAIHKSGGRLSIIADGDCVGKDISLLFGHRLGLNVSSLNLNFDMVLRFLFHLKQTWSFCVAVPSVINRAMIKSKSIDHDGT